MVGKRWLAALLLMGIGLLCPAQAVAGSLLGPRAQPPDCPRGFYSPCHYWVPTAYRLRDWHGSRINMYAPPPPLPPHYQILKTPCPAIEPAALYGFGPVVP